MLSWTATGAAVERLPRRLGDLPELLDVLWKLRRPAKILGIEQCLPEISKREIRLLPFLGVHRQGLFAEQPLAGLSRGERDVFVGVVRRADVDHVDVFPVEEAIRIRTGEVGAQAI